MIRIKRIYEPAAPADGYRVLVDRIWPRGVGKASVRIDEWLREVAPSHGLRRWYGHDPKRWEAFCVRYFGELAGKPEIVRHLRQIASERTVTLLFGAREVERNNAAALKICLDRSVRAPSQQRTHQRVRVKPRRVE